jgi:Fe-S cluster assembly protein SufD
MNKLFFIDDEVITKNVDDSIEIEFISKSDIFTVNTVKIKVKKDSYLEIDYVGKKDYKMNIYLYLEEEVDFSLFEKRIGKSAKIKYNYYVDKNATLNINRFHDVKSVKEWDIFNLIGENAKVDFNFKTISKDKERYDLVVNHNKDNTISNIVNSGVNIDSGALLFNVSSVVPKNVKGCQVDQTARIINLTDNECVINPNLYIEDSDVVANHAAAIGKFSEEELFYLMSRGIPYNDAVNLLIKGFLVGSFDINDKRIEEIKGIVDSYWR